MRGTRWGGTNVKHVHGIIPAYAGNTRLRPLIRVFPWDHPRVCGEHVRGPSHLGHVVGSSPRMRGTPGADGDAPLEHGIIPAYAGNTKGDVEIFNAVRDHPRVCGEHWSDGWLSILHKGSSPRMRGTPASAAVRFLVNGIIPAYAGNTVVEPVSRYALRDHPRVCGEHRHASDRRSMATGSSPRMRGTPETPSFSEIRLGIIPAYAGNTS